MGWYRTIDSKGAVGRPIRCRIYAASGWHGAEGREKDVAAAIANNVDQEGLRTASMVRATSSKS